MDPISLTDFVDFVAKSGTPKLTQVRKVKARGAYDPATDFWRAFRAGVVSFHEGGGPKTQLDQIVTGLSDKKKVVRYSECVDGYKKFLGRKKLEWLPPATRTWSAGGLDIRVNPEIGLKVNGAPTIIKLHMKATPVPKNRVDVVLLLMREALEAPPGVAYGVLDVPRAKLHSTASPDQALLPLLVGEAASFRTIWDQL